MSASLVMLPPLVPGLHRLGSAQRYWWFRIGSVFAAYCPSLRHMDATQPVAAAPPPKKLTFLDLAGPDESDTAVAPPPPPKKKVTFLDLAGPPPKPPTFDTSDPAAMRADIVAHGGSGPEGRALLAAFDAKYPNATKPPAPAQAGAGRGTMPASAYARLPDLVTGAAAIPTSANDWRLPGSGDRGPTDNATPHVQTPLWQKAIGGHEAALTTLSGMTTGFMGGLAGGAKALATGQPVEAGFNEGARQFTYSPHTTSGQDQAEDIGNALSYYGPSLIGIGPEIAMVGRSMRPSAQGARAFVGTSVDRSLGGMQQAFGERIAPPRVEPTMSGTPPAATGTEPALGAKPRYKLVNGEAQLVDAPPAGEPAPYVPSIKDTSPELQSAIGKVKGPLNDAVVSRHIEAETLPVPIRLTKGQATQDPTLLSNEMNLRGSQPELAAHYNEQGKLLVQNVDALRDQAAPDVKATNHVENGQSLVDSYKTMDEAAQADISAKYKALADANGGTLPLDGKAFAAAADAALAKNLKSNHVPAGIAADLTAFREGAPMTFEDFESLRSNLAAEARSNTNGNQVGAANIIRSTLESLPMTNETAAIKPLADAARSAAKARFDAINADPAYKAAANDAAGVGEQSPAADNFINNYVVKGKVANVAQMRQSLASDPVAQQTMAAGVINYLKNKAGADPVTGNFSQAGYNRALAEIAPKLNQLFDPKTAQQIQALGNVAKYTQAQPRGSFVNNSNTFVAALGDKAATGLEKAGNLAVPGLGLGTDVRAALARRAVRKGVDDVLRPGAGVMRLSDLMKK